MTAAIDPGTRSDTPTSDSRELVLGWAGFAARLVFGLVLVYAGGSKLSNLDDSVLAVRAYRLLPWDATAVVGYALPIVEVILGVMLVLGLFTRVVSAISALLMVAFIFGISWAWAHGYSIDCGCFGGGGQIAWEEAQRLYPRDILRDVDLVLAGVFLILHPRTALSVDAWLFRPVTVDDLDPLPDDSEPEETHE